MARRRSICFDKAVTILERDGCITAKQIKEEVKYKHAPSILIEHMRNEERGIRVRERGCKRNGNNTTWELYEGDGRIAQPMMGEGPKLEDIEVECRSCGAPITVQVWPGETHHIHKYCDYCLARDPENLPDRCPSQQIPKRAPVTGSECKIYRPGDKGFAARAKECTPPREIKTRLADLVSSVRFSFKY